MPRPELLVQRHVDTAARQLPRGSGTHDPAAYDDDMHAYPFRGRSWDFIVAGSPAKAAGVGAGARSPISLYGFTENSIYVAAIPGPEDAEVTSNVPGQPRRSTLRSHSTAPAGTRSRGANPPPAVRSC